MNKKIPLIFWSFHVPPEQKKYVIDNKIKTSGCSQYIDGEWKEIA
jgi:hypothetical protein